jgi:tetratricopeptide (TPR) repeat protein
MSAKHQKRAQQVGTEEGADSLALMRWLLKKENFKDAVREGKIRFRKEGSEESRRLLEQAFLSRAKQLFENGLTESAREVSRHLLEFGVTDPELVREVPDLLVAVGLANEALGFQDRLQEPEGREALILKAADAAVVDPEHAPPTLPELKEGGRRVRDALEAIEAGDEARAFEGLRAIPRGSPFAEWRLFARGLAAYYRRDDDEARANWDRLDRKRRPARIAACLATLAGWASGPGADFAVLELRVFGEPVLTDLEQVRDALARQAWDVVLPRLGTLRGRLRRIDPALPGRLTTIVYATILAAGKSMSYAECRRIVGKLTQVLEAPALDPRWNRLWSLLWEMGGDPAEAESFWQKYIHDLEHVEALVPDERRLAQALVWKHIARLVDDDEPDPFGFPFGHPARTRTGAGQNVRVIQCLEESLRLCPTHKPTYTQLFRTYVEWEEPEKAEATARRLLERFPDDEETLRFLVHRALDRDEAQEALGYLRRVRALMPLDRGLVIEEWNLLLELARVHALNKRWDEGRKAFEAAERARPEGRETLGYLARRALFEHKAGRAAEGNALIERAKATLPEPGAVWLQLHAEAIRYRLNNLSRDFAVEWAPASNAKPTSETAGALAKTLFHYFQEEIKYSQRSCHETEVVNYLRKTRKLAYRLEDLRMVCLFLDTHEPDEAKLLETLATKGSKTFPKSAYFPYLVAVFELRKGPFHCNRPRSHKFLEQARTLAESSGDPEDSDLLPVIKTGLTLLKDFEEGPFARGPFGGGPFRGGGGGTPIPLPPGFPDPTDLPPELREALFAMLDRLGAGLANLDSMDDDFFEDDDEFGPIDFIPPGAPRPRGGARKKKNKRSR